MDVSLFKCEISLVQKQQMDVTLKHQNFVFVK